MDSPSFVCVLERGDSDSNLVPSMCQRICKDAQVKPVTVLADKPSESCRSMSIRHLFLRLFREHKLGGSKAMMYLPHEEHLVAVQLSIAEWNKRVKGVYEADVHSVLEASRAILAAKLEPFTKDSNPCSPSRKRQKVPTVATPKNQKSTIAMQSEKGTPLGNRIPLPNTSSGTPLVFNSPKTPGGISRLHQLRGSPNTPRVPPHQTPIMTPSPGVRLTDSPGTPVVKLTEEVAAELLEIYNSFVKKCGKVDIVDVYSSVRNHFEANENDRLLLLKEHLFLINVVPKNSCEREMLKYLVGDQPVHCLSRTRVPLDGLCWDHVPGEGEDLCVACIPVSYLLRSPVLVEHLTRSSYSDSCENPTSVSERFIRKLFFSYISLLVNSADEMALARCLCLPDRGLSHEGFTALKHVAQEKNMSMFLTAFSFVFDLRRVKRASDSYAPLFEHSKALSEFVDIADRLLTITQDVPVVDQSAEKVLKSLKTTLIKSKSCVLRPESVKEVFTQLIDKVREMTSDQRVDLNLTPKPVGSGGSMRGQKVIKLFRTMLDIEATDNIQNEGFEDLVDQESSQRTPVRLPSIFSQFRSPSVQEQSSDSLNSENDEDHKTPEVSYTKTHYGWVGPSLLHRETPPVSRAYAQGSNVTHLGSGAQPHKVVTERSPLREIAVETTDKSQAEQNVDKNSAAPDESGEGEVPAKRVKTTPILTKAKKAKKQPLKRKKLELEGGSRAGKKQRTEKKKNVSLQKGQRLLTNFFMNPKP